eukprot:gene31300-41713_t
MYGEADDIAAADIRKEREADWHLTYRTYMAKRLEKVENKKFGKFGEKWTKFGQKRTKSAFVSSKSVSWVIKVARFSKSSCFIYSRKCTTSSRKKYFGSITTQRRPSGRK